jgi:hypothetical protein
MHVSVLSDVVRGGITAADILEGLAVTLSNSGVVNGNQQDLPTIVAASESAAPVYVLEAAPDNFSRPVDLRQYRAGWNVTLGREDSDFSEPLETITRYNVGISNLDNPTVPSGFLGLAHRGGVYTVPSTCYIDSADIKVPDNYIEVGAGSKWEYTASRTNAVGQVVEYDAATGNLTFQLWQ